MSITPAHTPALEPPTPQETNPNQGKSLFFGLLLGLALGAFMARSHYQPKILQQAVIASECKVELDKVATERREWVTVMREPGPASAGLFSMLGTLSGNPLLGAAGTMMDQSAAATSMVNSWGVPGKMKPLTRKPGTEFIWLNTRTGERLGPYQPLANPEAP